MLFPGQVPLGVPHLVVRVFLMKLLAMMLFLIEETYFGNVAANLRVLEFQKRALLLAHCLFFLDRESKQRLKRAGNVDELVLAEIPFVQNHGVRYLFLKNSIHTPYSPLHNSSAAPMKDGTCHK